MSKPFQESDAAQLFEQMDKLILVQGYQRDAIAGAIVNRIPGWHKLSVLVDEHGKISKVTGNEEGDWGLVADRELAENSGNVA